MNLDKGQNETLKDYKIRLCSNKDLYGLSFQKIADLINKESGEIKHESTYRKWWCAYREGFLDAEKKAVDSSNVFKQYEEKKREIDEARIKLQTEKIEYNKWIREKTRNELIDEKLREAILNIEPLDIPKKITYTYNDKEYCLFFGDEHYGVQFEIKDLFGNIINSYSPEVFENRMWNLLSQLVELIRKEDIKRLNVYSLGDFSDGCLRVSQLMKLRYGVVDSTIKYAHFISSWLNELTKYVVVRFQMTDGNHTELRQLGQPKGSFPDDNMGKVVREIIKIRLENNPNFEFISNPTGYIYDEILGINILGIHGEVKNMEKTLRDFSYIYNVQIQYLFGGHFHHYKNEEVGINSEVINIPSIVGTDPYALNLQKTSNSAGKLIVFERDKGKVCEYTLKLN